MIQTLSVTDLPGTETARALRGETTVRRFLSSSLAIHRVGAKLHRHPYEETFIIEQGLRPSRSTGRKYRSAPVTYSWCPPEPRTAS